LATDRADKYLLYLYVVSIDNAGTNADRHEAHSLLIKQGSEAKNNNKKQEQPWQG
jgi:hypothetical protein